MLAGGMGLGLGLGLQRQLRGTVTLDFSAAPRDYIKSGTGPTSSVALYPTSGDWAQETENVPHSIYSHALGREIGMPVFGSFTNRWLRSEELDNAAVTKTNGSITANDRAAPDGETTADLFTADGVGSSSVSQAITVANSAPQLVSCFARHVDNQWIATSHDGFTNTPEAFHDVQNGSAGTGEHADIDAHGVIDAGGGWYICHSSVTSTDTGADSRVYLATADGTLGTPASGQDVHLWGLQHFDNPAFSVPPSLYIPTVGSIQSRTADDPQLMDSLLPLVSGEYIVAVRFHVDYVGQGANRYILLSQLDSNERIQAFITSSDTLRINVFSGGSIVFQATSPALTAGEHVVSFRISTNNFFMGLDGSQISAGGTGAVPNDPTNLYIGHSNGVSYLNGMIESITASRNLSDANGLAMSQL